MRKIIALIVCFVYYGCNNSEEYDYRGKIPESRLVIYAYVEADSLICAEISKSRTYTDNSQLDSTVDIKGQVYLNDRYAGGLRSMGNFRYQSDVRPQSGDKIMIKASYPELEEVSATTVVCHPFPGIKLDTSRIGNTLYLRIHVNDEGGAVNYYRLVVENETFIHGTQWNDGQVQIGNSVHYTYDVDLSGDELLSGEVISTIFGKEINANIYQVFTSEGFSGKEQILQASVGYPYSYKKETYYIEKGDTIRYLHEESHRLRVKVLRLDEPLYYYLRTLGIYEKQPDMYKEPVQIFSNVQGGLGVVGSSFTREIVLEFPADK